MQEVFEKIIEKLEGIKSVIPDLIEYQAVADIESRCDEINDLIKEYNNGWIPCSERLPKVEKEVYILAKRKWKSGEVRYITTTAMYEDGTVRENDSCWMWYDIEGEWDEDEECFIIPEGWWESRHYNPDDIYNNTVDDEVIAWQPLPEPYQPKGERE